MKFKVGDRVKVTEKLWDPVLEETSCREVEGTVVAVHDARTLYPKRPKYKPSDRRTPRRDNKYAPGEVICQVVLDGAPVRAGEPIAQNYPQSQVQPC